MAYCFSISGVAWVLSVETVVGCSIANALPQPGFMNTDTFGLILYKTELRCLTLLFNAVMSANSQRFTTLDITPTLFTLFYMPQENQDTCNG